MHPLRYTCKDKSVHTLSKTTQFDACGGNRQVVTDVNTIYQIHCSNPALVRITNTVRIYRKQMFFLIFSWLLIDLVYVSVFGPRAPDHRRDKTQVVNDVRTINITWPNHRLNKDYLICDQTLRLSELYHTVRIYWKQMFFLIYFPGF